MNNLDTQKIAMEDLRNDIAKSQKKGLPFILASVLIWTLILITTHLDLPIETSNLIVFCCSCPLLPLAYIIGKMIKVDIFKKDNPLTSAGFLFTCNQLIYLLIVMWIFNAVPDKMVMVYAMVFGAHLLPYSWLYKSASYRVFAIAEPIIALATGCLFNRSTVALVMLVSEVIFVMVLFLENKTIKTAPEER